MEWIATVQFEKNSGTSYNALYVVKGDTEAQARAEAIDVIFKVKDVCKGTILSIEPQN